MLEGKVDLPTRADMSEVLRFLVVGTIGFLTEAVILTLLVRVGGIDPLIARLFSFPPAFCVTWLLNRRWTFATGRRREPGNQLIIYLFVQLSGLAINYVVFAVLVLATAGEQNWLVLALAISSIAAAVLTFVLSKFVAFAAP